MTAEEAFNKTKEVIKAYQKGELLGGDPMCYIKQYAEKEREKAFRMGFDIGISSDLDNNCNKFLREYKQQNRLK